MSFNSDNSEIRPSYSDKFANIQFGEGKKCEAKNVRVYTTGLGKLFGSILKLFDRAFEIPKKDTTTGKEILYYVNARSFANSCDKGSIDKLPSFVQKTVQALRTEEKAEKKPFKDFADEFWTKLDKDSNVKLVLDRPFIGPQKGEMLSLFKSICKKMNADGEKPKSMDEFLEAFKKRLEGLPPRYPGYGNWEREKKILIDRCAVYMDEKNYPTYDALKEPFTTAVKNNEKFKHLDKDGKQKLLKYVEDMFKYIPDISRHLYTNDDNRIPTTEDALKKRFNDLYNELGRKLFDKGKVILEDLGLLKKSQ